jgi:hypothetical protein
MFSNEKYIIPDQSLNRVFSCLPLYPLWLLPSAPFQPQTLTWGCLLFLSQFVITMFPLKLTDPVFHLFRSWQALAKVIAY